MSFFSLTRELFHLLEGKGSGTERGARISAQLGGSKAYCLKSFLISSHSDCPWTQMLRALAHRDKRGIVHASHPELPLTKFLR